VQLLGDLHGDTTAALAAIRRAQRDGCGAIVQLGDFGYWENTPAGERYLDVVDAALEAAGLPLYWLDGNHENHELLVRRYGAGRGRLTTIRPRLFHLGRDIAGRGPG
jgi:hypothetical protein